MGVLGFIRVRLVRLYPIFLLGLTFGLLQVAETAWRGLDIHGWAVALVLNSLYLPAPPSHWGGLSLSPIDGPAWSLMFEVWVNIGFAVFHRHLTTVVLAVIVTLSAMIVTYAALVSPDALDAHTWPMIWAVIARTTFSFPLGLLIYRHRHRFPDLGRFAYACGPLLVVGACIRSSPVSDLIFVFLISPLFVVAASQAPTAPLLSRWGARSSYALYAIHLPLERIVSDLSPVAGMDSRYAELFLIVILLFSAGLLEPFYDRPVRRWLASFVLPPQSARS